MWPRREPAHGRQTGHTAPPYIQPPMSQRSLGASPGAEPGTGDNIGSAGYQWLDDSWIVGRIVVQLGILDECKWGGCVARAVRIAASLPRLGVVPGLRDGWVRGGRGKPVVRNETPAARQCHAVAGGERTAIRDRAGLRWIRRAFPTAPFPWQKPGRKGVLLARRPTR